jgi:hypothetical protein
MSDKYFSCVLSVQNSKPHLTKGNIHHMHGWLAPLFQSWNFFTSSLVVVTGVHGRQEQITDIETRVRPLRRRKRRRRRRRRRRQRRRRRRRRRKRRKRRRSR